MCVVENVASVPMVIEQMQQIQLVWAVGVFQTMHILCHYPRDLFCCRKQIELRRDVNGRGDIVAVVTPSSGCFFFVALYHF